MRSHICVTADVKSPFDSNIWNQHMVDTFYKYCLANRVLPMMNQTDGKSDGSPFLELMGPMKTVSDVKQKYEYMMQTSILRMSPDDLQSQHGKQPSIKRRQRKRNQLNRYNIVISCCGLDGAFPQLLTDRLIDENYEVFLDLSDEKSLSIVPHIERADLVLICFTSNYYTDVKCREALRHAVSSGITVVPIIYTGNSNGQQKSWLELISTEESFYEEFQQEARFKLNEHLDLDYDRLLIELVSINCCECDRDVHEEI